MKQMLDYKKELEGAAKTMILIHNPEVLIKLIVRRIVNKVRVTHAGILLYNSKKNTYILTVSRGPRGIKIPTGFARMDCDNPLICFFTKQQNKPYFPDSVIEINRLKSILRHRKKTDKAAGILSKVLYQLEIFEAVACVPSFFREQLLGVLFLGKKVSGLRFRQDELDFFSALASDVAMAIRNAQLFEDIEEESNKRRSLFLNTTNALAAAIDAKDSYTRGHTSRVINYSLSIFEALKKTMKLDEKFKENLHIASLLHDIGKIGIPEGILHKKSRLTQEERTIIQQHPVIGVSIVQSIKELDGALPGIRHHHERFDGTGYPDGLKGRQIPVVAAVISVADAFDAITTDRPYRKRFTLNEALLELKRCSATQFDPAIVKAAQKALAK